MSKEEIGRIVDKLIADKTNYLWEKDAVDAFLQNEKFEYSKENLTFLIDLLITKSNIFQWINFIGSKLSFLASEDEQFLLLLTKVLDKVKRDLSQGVILQGLIDIGSSNPALGYKLFEKAIKEETEPLFSYSGLILGGIGKKELVRVTNTIETGMKSSNGKNKLLYLRALRVTFEGLTDRKEFVFSMLKQALTSENDAAVKNEIAQAFVDFYDMDPTESTMQLLNLVHYGDSQLRKTIAERIWFGKISDKKASLLILKECAFDENIEVVRTVAYALSVQGVGFPEKSLDIIKQIVKRYSYLTEVDYALKEIGKKETNRSIDLILDWQNDKDSHLTYLIPYVLSNLSSNDYSKLIDRFDEIIRQKNVQLFGIIVKTLQEILADSMGNLPLALVERIFNVFKAFILQDFPLENVESALIVFGNRPRFANAEILSLIMEKWATDEDWRVRKAIIFALRELSEDKVDEKETVQLAINEKTGESAIIGVNVELVSLPESLKAYELLQSLTEDGNPDVKQEATFTLDKIDSFLKQKAEKITEKRKYYEGKKQHTSQ